jgi:hypothetical protein
LKKGKFSDLEKAFKSLKGADFISVLPIKGKNLENLFDIMPLL